MDIVTKWHRKRLRCHICTSTFEIHVVGIIPGYTPWMVSYWRYRYTVVNDIGVCVCVKMLFPNFGRLKMAQLCKTAVSILNECSTWFQSTRLKNIWKPWSIASLISWAPNAPTSRAKVQPGEETCPVCRLEMEWAISSIGSCVAAAIQQAANCDRRFGHEWPRSSKGDWLRTASWFNFTVPLVKNIASWYLALLNPWWGHPLLGESIQAACGHFFLGRLCRSLCRIYSSCSWCCYMLLPGVTVLRYVVWYVCVTCVLSFWSYIYLGPPFHVCFFW